MSSCWPGLPVTLPKGGITADINVTRVNPREFEVRVREGGRETGGHRVAVPEGRIRELRLPVDDLKGMVRESFRSLLEHEPASSIPPEVSLGMIPTYFPK